jgi:hypothetical protein
MAEAKTYEGSCHCGAVKYTVTTDFATVMQCNCSHCSRKGFLLTFVPAAQFTLQQGDEALTEYRFNRQHIEHLFCGTCGVQSFARGKTREGAPTVMVNVRCLPDVDLATLTIKQVDGKSF